MKNFDGHNFSKYFADFQKHVVAKYRVEIALGDLAPTITGDFDGERIVIRNDLDADARLFIAAHLFGHTVQFNTSPTMRQIGLTQFGPHNTNPEILEIVRLYEEEASRYALHAFHEMGIYTLDQWLSDWVAGDWRYLEKLYRDGGQSEIAPEQIPFFKNTYVHSGAPRLAPLSIPPFTPKKGQSRYSF